MGKEDPPGKKTRTKSLPFIHRPRRSRAKRLCQRGTRVRIALRGEAHHVFSVRGAGGPKPSVPRFFYGTAAVLPHIVVAFDAPGRLNTDRRRSQGADRRHRQLAGICEGTQREARATCNTSPPARTANKKPRFSRCERPGFTGRVKSTKPNRTALIARARPNRLQAGLLASGSFFRRAFPSGIHSRTVASVRRSSPVTAARPRPILTAFPFVPRHGTPAAIGRIATFTQPSSQIHHAATIFWPKSPRQTRCNWGGPQYQRVCPPVQCQRRLSNTHFPHPARPSREVPGERNPPARRANGGLH